MGQGNDWSSVLGGWEAGAGPIYVRLSAALRGAIERAELEPGTQLPPERALAQELGLSRTTVVNAYGRLAEDGWIEGRQGSGTFVRRGAARGTPSAQEREIVGAFRRNMVFRGLLEDPGSTVEFLGAHLHAAPEVERALDATVRLEGAELCASHGYLPFGLPALRRAIAAHLTRAGLPTRVPEVLITNGAQQAIHLAASLFVERGDLVAIEDPTYLGAIDVFNAAGARPLPVPVGPDGVDVARLREAFAAGPRLAYLIPTFHNPTGVVLPEPGRRAIARLCAETQIPIVEDHALSDLALGDDPPPPIAAFAREAPILTIGSLSKLFWGGLRVGWVRGPEALVERLARFKAVVDLGGPLVSQAVAARVLPEADRVRRARRREITRKLDGLTGHLKRRLPEWSWRRPAGGLLLWARLPRGNASEFAQVAERHGVALVPGSVNSPTGGFSHYVRLPFILDEAQLAEGVTRLARAWTEYETSARERRAELGVIV